MMAQKPLMLKDYLELEWDYESSGAGFRCPPRRADGATVRCLLHAELGGGGRRLPRTQYTSALTRISAVINAVRLLPFAASTAHSPASREGFLSRSFTRRLRAGFWRKRGKAASAVEEEDEVRVKHIVRPRSFRKEGVGNDQKSSGFPSPTVSTCSSWSKSDSFGSDFRPFSTASTDASDDIPSAAVKKGSPRASPSSSPKVGRKTTTGEISTADAAGHRRKKQATESEGKESPECHSEEEEEKEQLSPVSVMDFPSEEEDEDEEEADGTASPSFHHSLSKLERTKLQLLHNIGQLESLADLEPIDLDRRFAACDDHSSESSESSDDEDGTALRERKAWGLLEELNASCHVEACVERLLVDFFIQGLSPCSSDNGRPFRRRHTGWTSAARHEAATEEEALLNTARHWKEGARCWDLDDYQGEATLREMEKEARWGSLDEEGELEVDVEVLVLGSLMEELVVDLLSC